MPLNKIRIYIRERNATETYGLFDDSKSLKGRLKSLYKAKAPKLATTDYVRKQLDKYDSKEEKLVRDLAKKYKLKAPVNLLKTFQEMLTQTRKDPSNRALSRKQ